VTDDRFANGASAPNPDREHSSRTLSLLNDKKGKGFGDVNPQAGMGGSPFAERYVIRIATTVALLLIALSIAILASCLPAHAAGSGMPWEAPLQRILESIEGPVAKIVAVIIIIVTGLSLAFGDMGGGFRRLIQIVFGLSIAFAATSFFLSFFSFAGGALIN
jgi:type IV secretion system protein TrbC